MAVELLTPFTQVERRSLPQAQALLTGRWVAQNASGQADYPGGGAKTGLYLVLEGQKLHIGSNAEFSGVSPFPSTNAVDHPAVLASGATALAYGAFRYSVGPEGCNPAAVFAVGGLVEIDAAGRVIPLAGGTAIGRVEALETNGGGVTKLTLRTFGN